jgi:hypothetical protein
MLCAMLTLPEDLVILAVGAKPRGGPDNGKLPWRFGYGIRGAVLVALALAGRVEVADGTIVVRDQASLGDKDLDEALAGLTVPGGVPAGDWMKGSPVAFAVPWFKRVEAAGLLRPETVWLLFIAKREGYRLADTAHYESLRALIRDAATRAGQADPAMTALAGLVYAGDIARLVFPGGENAPLRKRLAELADPGQAPASHTEPAPTDDPTRRPQDLTAGAAAQHAVHHATREAVHAATHEAVQAAVHASVQAAVSAAATAAHHHSGSSSGSDSAPAHHH